MNSSNPTRPGRLSWETCFAKLNERASIEIQVARRAAALLLVSEGADEVGSSDVNHRIFCEFRRADGDILAAIDGLHSEAFAVSGGNL
jgi:hypothetical protein